MLLAALENTEGTALDIILINAGAALYVAGVAVNIAEGIDLARAVVASGAARAKVNEYVTVTQALKNA